MLSAAVFAAPSAYDFSFDTIDGKASSLADYRGEVILAVNVASKCGYTGQYAGLQKLHEKYAGKGLRIVGLRSRSSARSVTTSHFQWLPKYR